MTVTGHADEVKPTRRRRHFGPSGREGPGGKVEVEVEAKVEVENCVISAIVTWSLVTGSWLGKRQQVSSTFS
jgi:hypothetical protein